MDSESSSQQPSLDLESSRSSKRTAATWTYTRIGRSDRTEDPTKRYCLLCEKENLSPIYSTTVTTNLKLHLKGVHNITIEQETSRLHVKTQEQLQQLYLRAELSGHTSEIDTKVFKRYLDQDVIIEALISLITIRSLPFRIVEWPEFHAFCQVLNPESKSVLTTTHSNVRTKLKDSWLSHKDVVRRKLQSTLLSVHISLDIWTSPQGYLLLGVIGHFIERQDENHIKALLGLRLVPGHSGEDQFSVLLPILQDYGIVKQLGAVMGDNASSNDTLCRQIEEYFQGEGLNWDASQWRVRCLGHIINLSVQAFLFHNIFTEEDLQFPKESNEELEDLEVEREDESREKQVKYRLLGPLGQLHNIVVHIRKSPSRIVEYLALAPRMVPLDNQTRWNSWYLMLEVALGHAGYLDTYSKAHFGDLEEDYLNPKDWEKLEIIMAFLKPFYKATLRTQGDAATIDRVLFTMDILIEVFKKGLVSNLFLIILY
jgi:hypothetical protein